MSLSRQTTHRLLAVILLIGIVTWVLASLPCPRLGKWRDEKYSMDNVEHIVTTDEWKPVLAWYPALSHLPLAAVLEVTLTVRESLGLASRGIVRSNGEMGPWAFWIGRWMSALFAAFCVVWIYRFGRHTVSRPCGLLAAALLVLSPSFHFYASVFKPDMLALLLTLLSFSVAIRAFDRYALGDYLLAGTLVGLAASAKQTGALAAIPLVVVTVLRAGSWRRWVALATAGILSMTVFYALNPDPELIYRYLLVEQRFEDWAVHQAPAPVPTVFYLPVLAVDSSWHGPFVGVAAGFGLVWMMISIARSRLSTPFDGKKALVVAFVLLYPVACALGSNHPKANLLLPTLPLTALAATWFLCWIWAQVEPRISRRHRTSVLVLLLVILFLATAAPFASYFYARVVYRTTMDEVASAIQRRLGSLAHRAVVHEEGLGRFGIADTTEGRKLTFAYRQPVDRLIDLSPIDLDLQDYEIFAPSRLEGPDRARYQERLDRFVAESLWIVEPSVFKRRGPPIAVLEHPWKIKARYDIAWKTGNRRRGRSKAALPQQIKNGMVVSLDVAWSKADVERCELVLGKLPLDLDHYYRDRYEPRFMTRRMVLQDRTRKLRIDCEGGGVPRSLPSLTLIVWRPGRFAQQVPF